MSWPGGAATAAQFAVTRVQRGSGCELDSSAGCHVTTRLGDSNAMHIVLPESYSLAGGHLRMPSMLSD